MSRELIVASPEQALVNSWIAAMALEDLSDTSKNTYRNGMMLFMRWLTDNNIQSVTPSIIKRFVSDMKISHKPTSVNVWLAGIKRFFAWADETGYLPVNPSASVKNLKRKNANKTHLRDSLTDHEVLRVLAQPDRSTEQGKRDYAIIALKAFTAIRDIETNRADLSDISTQNGLPVLRVQGKGDVSKSEFAVIFHPKAQEALYDWLAVRGNKAGALFTSLSNRSIDARLTLSAIRHLMIGYYRQAGIIDPRKTSHSLRHSAISKVAKHDILKAQQVARHSKIDTTMIYVHQIDRMDNPGEQWIDYANGL